MRFKKGNRVEVFSKKEVPSGSWRCAEILSGNGHHYDVKYDWSPGTMDEVTVERVPRKVIRPSPLPGKCAENWVSGDVVEVFDNNSWKIASVSKAMSGDYFLVRLLGSLRQFRVHNSDLRVRQSWQDNKWVVVGKGSAHCEDGGSDKVSTPWCYQEQSFQVPQTYAKKRLCVGEDCFPVENNCGFQESHMVSSRTLKRGSPYCSSHIEPHMATDHKKRAIEKDGRCQGLVRGHPSPLPGKVDAVASSREMLCENYMLASFNNRTTGFSEMDLERGKPNGNVGCFLARSLESDDAESIASSVGSCSSASNSPFKLLSCSLVDLSQDGDSHFDDAESFCGRVYEKRCLLPTKEELTAEIHKLELHAYRCTMEALYASGTLSWEQEALMTNLRLMLHISNDEHLRKDRSWRLVQLASKGLKMIVGSAISVLMPTVSL